jgi:transcriptional regulator with XRE-family HTH domain
MIAQARPDPLATPPIDCAAPNVLRHMRLDADLSIRQMSDLTGINRGRISVIERGALATPWELHRILDALYEYGHTPRGRRTASWTVRHDAR